MSVIARRRAVFTAVVLGFFLAAGSSQNRVAAQSSDQKVEEAFKNIKSLNGQPADMLNPTMVFFEASLGVGCPYCHDNDGNKRELDSKPQKLIARQMIEMVNSVNKTTFRGQRQVTCFTCHQGRAMPIGVPNTTNESLPPALGEDYEASLAAEPPVPAAMTAVQVIDKYVAALGAVQQVASVDAVGTVTQRRPGRDFPAQQIEIVSKAPGMGLTITKAGAADNLLAYGTTTGWARAGNTAPRDLRKAEADGAMLEDPFNLPAHLKQMLLEPKMDRPEIVNAREMYVITGKTRNLPKVQAYFDKQSGTLTRLVYFNETLFGQYPTRIDYKDFRDVNGRKVPFEWVISQTRNREYTYAMQAIKAAPVEDSRFAKPAASSR
jgi:photosynthetic reaction center cytochrome c subunit